MSLYPFLIPRPDKNEECGTPGRRCVRFPGFNPSFVYDEAKVVLDTVSIGYWELHPLIHICLQIRPNIFIGSHGDI